MLLIRGKSDDAQYGPSYCPGMEVVECPDGLLRCSWGVSTPDYLAYHDREWGWPVSDDVRLFEKLSLEAFQSGLSWLTVLRKREAFRSAFHGFQIEKVAAMTPEDVERLLGDATIIRHRGKIEATISNAGKALALQTEAGSLAAYVWRFEPPADFRPMTPTTPQSTALARALKERGWARLGPTTVHAFMEAMGIVNDHLPACHIWEPVEVARAGFQRP